MEREWEGRRELEYERDDWRESGGVLLWKVKSETASSMIRLPSSVLFPSFNSLSRPRLYLSNSSTLFCRAPSPLTSDCRCSLVYFLRYSWLSGSFCCNSLGEISLSRSLLVTLTRQRPFSLLTFILRLGVFPLGSSCGIWYAWTVLKLGSYGNSAVILDSGEEMGWKIFLRLWVGDRTVGMAMSGSDYG